MKTEFQEPMFPTVEHASPEITTTPGATILDMFANSAMQAILRARVSRGMHTTDEVENYEQLAEASYTCAEAMLKERDKRINKI